MSGSYYDVAQICLNGHIINSMASDYPQSNQKFCKRCGEPTTNRCESCNTNIRGYYHVPGVLGGSGIELPAYCHECGNPYPWTERSLAAAVELAQEFDALDEEDRDLLKKSLPDLLREGPNQTVAETRFKKIMAKAGREAYTGMKAILVNVLSEAAKKSLFGQ